MKSKKALMNVFTNTIAQVMSVILSFVSRKVFLMTLGDEVLGLNSLFSSLLAFLTLTELGVGVSISMCLYKPLAEKNEKLVSAYMSFLRKIYIIIGSLIFVFGILMVPFLDIVVNGNYNQKFVIISFILYLLSTAATYFFSYKKILLGADQKSYIVSASQIFYKIIINLSQIYILISTKSYYLFLIIGIVCNVGENIVVSRICDKQYPYLKQKTEGIGKKAKLELFEKVKGMLCYKLSNYLIEGTDNIIISFFLGTIYVTYYSNYYLVINMLFAIFACFGTSSIAGLGNILYTDKINLQQAFSKLLMVQHFVYSFSTAALCVLISDFIEMFFGINSVLAPFIVGLMVCIYYVKGYSQGIEALRNCAGLYEKDKYINLLIAVLNIIISCALIYILGIGGVLIGTLICYILKELIVTPWLIFNDILPKMKKWYYKTFFIHTCVTCIIVIVCLIISEYIDIANRYIDWGVGGAVCFIFSIGINVLFFRKTKEMQAIKNMLVSFIRRRK